jgi:hypothetical protein
MNIDEKTMKEQQTEVAKKALAAEARRMFKVKPEDNLHWKGLKTDLIEMTYYLFCEGSVRDDTGFIASFRYLVNHICSNMHVVVPRNPSAYINRARRIKGIRRTSLIERYMWQKCKH